MIEQGVPGVRSGEDLRQIEGIVRDRLGGRIADFLLSAAAGGLVLHGRSRTYYTKQLAQQIVMEIARQPIEANQIEVH